MSVTAIGTRLVRTFGEGTNAIHFIVEKSGNKTYRRVINSEGNVIRNSLKEITIQNRGNQKIITKKIGNSWQRDAVYDNKGNFLGMRVLIKDENSVLKVDSKLYGKIKSFDPDTKKVVWSAFGRLRSKNPKLLKIVDPYSTFKSYMVTMHNNLGLPIPQTFKGNPKDMPLQKMIKDTSCPTFEYGSGFEHIKPVIKFDLVNYVKNMKWNSLYS